MNGGVQGPDDQEETDIRAAQGVNFIVVEHPDDAQCDPECTVGNKSAVSKIVAAFEFLKSSDQLSAAAECEGPAREPGRCRKNRGCESEESSVVKPKPARPTTAGFP
jgi:hypothetical protein